VGLVLQGRFINDLSEKGSWVLVGVSEFILKPMGSQILVFRVTVSFDLYPGVQCMPWGLANFHLVTGPRRHVQAEGSV